MRSKFYQVNTQNGFAEVDLELIEQDCDVLAYYQPHDMIIKVGNNPIKIKMLKRDEDGSLSDGIQLPALCEMAFNKLEYGVAKLQIIDEVGDSTVEISAYRYVRKGDEIIRNL